MCQIYWTILYSSPWISTYSMVLQPVNVIAYRYHIWPIHGVRDLEETGGALQRAGLLHDLFLYDWHTHARETGDHFHGFTHPRTAMENAKQYFELTEEEKDAILRHMWPLTPVPPSTRAGYAVTFADKMCCVEETKATVRRLAAVPGHILFAQAAERGKF